MLNEIIKTAEELNTAALYYRQSGNMDGVRELAKAHAVSKKQTEEFIQGSRYRLVDIPIEERKFANASEKLRAEVFALKDAGFADIIGQYLVNLAKTDSALDAQVLKKHKMLQRCLDYVTQKAYNIALEEAKKKGETGIRANTGLALSDDQVFPWVLEYYAKDDEKEIAEKEQEEKKKISHMEGCMPKEVTKKEEIPENQVMSKERHRAKEAFFYEGNKYISLGQCCEFYGINESSVRSRTWRKKCTWEEAVKYYIQKKETETPKMQFFYKGKKYKSVSACCAEYGVNASSVRNRAKTTECSIEESLDHFIKKASIEIQPSVFIFRDKTYRSLEECCLEYGVNADSVSSRKYRLNCTMEESLEHFIENKDMIAERIQKFTFKGIEYRSLRACCQKYGIDDICVRQRARDKNCSLEESFTHFMTRKRKKMLSNPEFEYHGTVYPSLKVCCEELGINKSSVISRSHRAGCSLQEAVEYYVSQQERRTLD